MKDERFQPGGLRQKRLDRSGRFRMAPLLPGLLLSRLAYTLLLVVAMSPPAGAAKFVDAIVAEIGLYTIAASDIGLARALGLYGLAPSDGPIKAGDIDRFIDARLIITESMRLGIDPTPDVLKKAWLEVAGRRGGTRPFEAWLEQEGIDEEWARQMVNSDARRSYFTQLRFTRFVFIPEEAITRALGPGQHGSEARNRAREALRRERAEKDLAQWLQNQRKRTTIRRFVDTEVPDPLAPSAAP